MEKLNKILARIDASRNDMVDMQIRLCAVPAISPQSGGEGEAKKADLLLQFLEKIGITKIENIKAPDLDAPSGYRPNILAVYPGMDRSKTIWIMTHMDIVPPGELAQWKGNPFRAWIEGGRIYGRGAEDNQQDMIASLFALKAFIDEGIQPNFNIGIALVADEETGNNKGIDFVLDNSDHFQGNDIIIVPDAGNSDGTLIEVAEKSILWLKVNTHGIQAHGSTPEKGTNCFKAASFLITEFSRLYQIYDIRDNLFDPPISTFEPTKKEANVPNINTIPGEDVFYLDCRILPQIDIAEVKSTMRKMADTIANRFNVTIGFEDIQNVRAAPPTSVDSPVVKALQKAVKAIYQVEGKPIGIGGGTVAAFFRERQMQAACWSKIDETAHQPNEYCIIDNMVGDAKVFAHIFFQD